MKMLHFYVADRITDPQLKRYLVRNDYHTWNSLLKQGHLLAQLDQGRQVESVCFCYQNVNRGWQLYYPQGYRNLFGDKGLTWLNRNSKSNAINIFDDVFGLFDFLKISKTKLSKITKKNTVFVNHRLNLPDLINELKSFDEVYYYFPDSKPLNLLFESAVLSNFYEAKRL